MSESAAKGGRYQRSSGGLVGAMIVTVVLVLAFVAFRSIFRENPETPVRTVDWKIQVKAGTADRKLSMLAPPALPTGWKATSASYDTGSSPAWHLGLLTASRKYVGIEEGRSSVEDLVAEHVDPDAVKGRRVQLGGETWQQWSDAGGDYGLSRTLTGPDRQQESVLVVGSAADADIRSLADGLRPGS